MSWPLGEMASTRTLFIGQANQDAEERPGEFIFRHQLGIFFVSDIAGKSKTAGIGVAGPGMVFVAEKGGIDDRAAIGFGCFPSQADFKDIAYTEFIEAPGAKKLMYIRTLPIAQTAFQGLVGAIGREQNCLFTDRPGVLVVEQILDSMRDSPSLQR